MGQYRTGTATFSTASVYVNGVGTEWLSNVSAGDLIKPLNSRVWAVVQSVVSDTQIQLPAVWGGDSMSGAQYVIHQDFTPGLSLPYPVPGDVDTQDVFRKAMLIIDSALSGGNTQVRLKDPIIDGTVLTNTTITLPAIILGGNVTSTGNPSLNLGSGALTAGATSVTTLAASGAYGSNNALSITATGGASNATLFLDSSAGNGYGSSIKYRSNTSGGTTNTWQVGTGVTGGANAFEFHDGTATRISLAIGGGTTISSSTGLQPLTLDTTNASSRGASIGFAQNGTIRGYVGISGYVLGTTAGDMSVYADTGKTINLWPNGQSTVGVQAHSTGATVTGGASGYGLTVTGNASSGQAAYLNQKNTTATTSAVDIHHEDTSGDAIFLKFFTETSATLRGSISYNRGGGVTAYNTTSGRESKFVIGDIEDATARLMQLRPVRARMAGASFDIDTFVADELGEVVPEAVTGEPGAMDLFTGNRIHMNADFTKVIPLLAAALQSHERRLQSAGI